MRLTWRNLITVLVVLELAGLAFATYVAAAPTYPGQFDLTAQNMPPALVSAINAGERYWANEVNPLECADGIKFHEAPSLKDTDGDAWGRGGPCEDWFSKNLVDTFNEKYKYNPDVPYDDGLFLDLWGGCAGVGHELGHAHGHPHSAGFHGLMEPDLNMFHLAPYCQIWAMQEFTRMQLAAGVPKDIVYDFRHLHVWHAVEITRGLAFKVRKKILKKHPSYKPQPLDDPTCDRQSGTQITCDLEIAFMKSGQAFQCTTTTVVKGTDLKNKSEMSWICPAVN